MTKTMKIIIGSVAILAIVLGGVLVYRHEKQVAMQQEMVKIVKENKNLIMTDLKRDDVTQKITEIDFDTIDYNPMGA